MFSQLPDETQNSQVSQNTAKRKKKKKASKKKFKRDKVHNLRITPGMSSWAENFTFAATWQLKHQLSYWKSKAKALEYENRILLDIVRKKCRESDNSNLGPREETQESDCSFESEDGSVVNDSDFEIDDDYINFLTVTAKHKEEIRLQKEQITANFETDDKKIAILEAGPSEVKESVEEQLKNMYGSEWQSISALEVSLESAFIAKVDLHCPLYWPNIPLNLNY